MKARVKATGEIVDVEFSHYIADIAWYKIKDQALYSENELEFIDEPQDYWTRLEHQYVGMIVGGMCGNAKYNDYAWVDMAKYAINAAHILVEKMKEERKWFGQ